MGNTSNTPATNTSKVFGLSLGKALTSLIALIAAMVLSRLMTVHEYATYRQTLLVYSFLVPFMTFGLPDAIYYFLGPEKERKRGILNENLFLLIFMGLLFGAFLLAGGNRLWAGRFSNPDLERTLLVFAPYALFVLPLGSISAVFVVQEKIGQLTLFNILSRSFIFIVILMAAFLYRDAISLITAEVLGSAVVFAVVLYLIYRVVPRDDHRLSRKSMFRMLSYSVPLGLSAMLGTLSINLNQVVVSSMCTPEEYAVYANGTLEIPVIGIITGSIATVILVEMRRLISDSDTAGALELFRKAALKSAPILIPLMFFLLVQAKPFIEVVFSKKYLDSIDPFRIYLLILPARIVFYSSALLAFGLTKVVLFRSFVSLALNAGLTIVFVYFWGYLGAIISFIVVLYGWDVLFNFRILTRHFHCKWHRLLPLKEAGLIGLVSALCPAPLLLLRLTEINSIISLAISAVVFFPLTFAILMRFGLVDISLSRIIHKLR